MAPRKVTIKGGTIYKWRLELWTTLHPSFAASGPPAGRVLVREYAKPAALNRAIAPLRRSHPGVLIAEIIKFENVGWAWMQRSSERRYFPEARASLISQIEANGWTAEFVRWCEDAETPGILGQVAGVTIHKRKAIKVRTEDATEAQIIAVLEHEIDHMNGARHAGDRPELGLHCGGRTNCYGKEVD
jgi:hypothetical protein